MSNRIIFVFSLIILIMLTGCISTDINADLTSPIEMYAPFMSSVPGFPLEVELDIKGAKPKEITVELETDRGIFLEWGSDMKVRDMGRSIEYSEGLVYWFPLDGSEGIVESAQIKVIVSCKVDAGKISQTFIEKIDKDDEGMYILVKD